MKKIIGQAAAFILIITFSIHFPKDAFSDLFPIPPIESDTAFIYQVTPVDMKQYKKRKWGFNYINGYTIEQHKLIRSPEGDKITMIIESIDKNVGSYIVTLDFMVEDGHLRQTRFLTEIITFSGETISRHEINFNKLRDLFPPDIYSAEIITFLFKGMNKTPKSTFSYYWLATEKAAIPMYTKMKKLKKITVPAGTFTCFPVEMNVNVADVLKKGKYINKIINPFLPKVVLYFDINPPHHFIHYRGPFGPSSSIEGNMDLIKIVKGKQAIKEARQQLRSPDFYAKND